MGQGQQHAHIQPSQQAIVDVMTNTGKEDHQDWIAERNATTFQGHESCSSFLNI